MLCKWFRNWWLTLQEATVHSGSALRRLARRRGCLVVTHVSTGLTCLRTAAMNNSVRSWRMPSRKQKALARSRLSLPWLSHTMLMTRFLLSSVLPGWLHRVLSIAVIGCTRLRRSARQLVVICDLPALASACRFVSCKCCSSIGRCIACR